MVAPTSKQHADKKKYTSLQTSKPICTQQDDLSRKCSPCTAHTHCAATENVVLLELRYVGLDNNGVTDVQLRSVALTWSEYLASTLLQAGGTLLGLPKQGPSPQLQLRQTSCLAATQHTKLISLALLTY